MHALSTIFLNHHASVCPAQLSNAGLWLATTLLPRRKKFASNNEISCYKLVSKSCQLVLCSHCLVMAAWRHKTCFISWLEVVKGIPNQSLVFTWSWLRYVRVFATANPFVICNACAPYSGGWEFRQYFFAILYLSHRLTSLQNFTETVEGKPLSQGIKRKRGSKTERCHIRVSHLLMSFL